MLKAVILNKEPVQKPDDEVGEELALHRKHHKIAERNVSDWLYARTLADEPNKQTCFTGEIFDINRAGHVFDFSKMVQQPLFLVA